MILVALAAAAATLSGVIAERRSPHARRVAQQTLKVMLYGLVPFVSYVSIAHLRVTTSSGLGLGLGWLTLGSAALIASVLGRSLLHLNDRALGAVVCAVVVTNTGYLGNPVVTALLGAPALRYGVAWDQLVGSPGLFVLGFGVGAFYGDGAALPWRTRLLRFVTRNPPLWGVIAGLLVSPSLAPNPLPTIATWVIDVLLVCGFFAAGVYLSSERRGETAPLIERPNRAVLLALGVRLLAAPLILLGLSALTVGVPTAYLVQSAMPTGLNTLIVGHAYRLDLRLIASIIVWSSLIVITTALILGAVG